MKRCMVPLLSLAGLLAAEVCWGQAVPKELHPLQGTWVLVSAESDGKAVVPAELQGDRFSVNGNQYTVTKQDRVVERGSLKIDTSKTPHTIDVQPMDGPFKGKTLQGIFEVQGGQARDCFARDGQPRPTEFASRPGSGTVIHVYRREKP